MIIRYSEIVFCEKTQEIHKDIKAKQKREKSKAAGEREKDERIDSVIKSDRNITREFERRIK